MHTTLQRLERFALGHDDLPAFHAGYLVLALIAASLFNMGAFTVLVACHMLLDAIKYRDRHGLSWSKMIQGVLYENLPDIALLFIGLTFAVYLHHSIPAIAGMSGVLRAEVTILRGVGTVIPRYKIFEHILKVVTQLHYYLDQKHPGLKTGFSTFECFCIASILVCTFLLVLAGSVLQLTPEMYLRILTEELIPWRL